MIDEMPPQSVRFPLRGDNWMAVTSPADRVPSHGTDILGQRYAFDFIRVDARKAIRYHPASAARTLLLGVPTRECYAWGQPVYAPFDARVVSASDGVKEPRRVYPVREILRAVWNAFTYRPGRYQHLLGNHVVIERDGVHAVLVHLAPFSVTVSVDQYVTTDTVLGKVGHTGNSTTPHLHFHLMDGPDPMTAQGVPCRFLSYDVADDHSWRPVTDGVPARGERIRSPRDDADG